MLIKELITNVTAATLLIAGGGAADEGTGRGGNGEGGRGGGFDGAAGEGGGG